MSLVSFPSGRDFVIKGGRREDIDKENEEGTQREAP